MKDQKEINPQSAALLAKWTTSDKPDWMSATSAYVVNVLIAHSADDHALKISYVELGAMCGCHQDAVKRAMTKELTTHKWVTKASSPWSAHEFTLTAEYLKHLKVKVEVNQDAKDFADWFHGVQKKNVKEIKPKIRKSVGAKTYEFRDHTNAARILSRVGGLTEAKTQTEFALTVPAFRKKALQGLYNLKAVLHSQSFKDQFAHGAPILVADEETAPKKLLRLREELTSAKERRKSLRQQRNMSFGPEKSKVETALVEQEKVVKAANDAAALQAMTMGISPESRGFPDEIENCLQYMSQFAAITSPGTSQLGGHHAIAI